MSLPVEGTLGLHGILEGRAESLADPEIENRVRDWIALAAAVSLEMSIEREGGRFSILAAGSFVDALPLGDEPGERFAGMLAELVEVFPREHRRALFSTLRLVEVRRGLELQTFYAITPAGLVETREQSREIETFARAGPEVAKHFVARGIVVALGTAVLIVASTLVVDYRAFWNRVVDAFVSADLGLIEVEAGGFSGFVTLRPTGTAKGGDRLVLSLARGPRFPEDDAGFDALAAGLPLRERLAVEALARGFARLEFFDDGGRYLGSAELRLAALRDEASCTAQVPFLGKSRLRTIRVH